MYLTLRFADFGQCNNLAEREESSWWTEHTRSFAMRQMGMYEREMGWSFWTWKLEDQLGGLSPVPASQPPSSLYFPPVRSDSDYSGS